MAQGHMRATVKATGVGSMPAKMPDKNIYYLILAGFSGFGKGGNRGKLKQEESEFGSMLRIKFPRSTCNTSRIRQKVGEQKYPYRNEVL